MIGAVTCAGNESEGSDKGGYLAARHWQLTVTYRNQISNRDFIGTQEQTVRREQGTVITNNVHLMDVAIGYQLSPRWSFNLSIPVMDATRRIPGKVFQLRGFPNASDELFHTRGIGDVVISGRAWVFRPPTESRQNIAIGFGLKLPSGAAGVKNTVNTPEGPKTLVADQSIQLGDGGTGIVFDAQAFKIVRRTTLFLAASYLINPRDTNGALTGRTRPSEAVMSVPDQYLLEAGAAYPVRKVRGLAVSLAGRMEGIPVRDIIGKSNGFRRPGYAISLGPGFEYARGKQTWTFGFPIAVRRDRKRSVPDIQDHTQGDAFFADNLILLGYTRRF